MTESDNEKQEAMVEAVQRAVESGKVRTVYDPDVKGLLFNMPGVTVANPADKRRN